ncbi:hypothetical protein RD792_009850 [Penstemon davidsonii]|uniref:Pentatricopeptide repeat-containing protein n=1 Tax=Penstemon davidsonii TaxID=160366 RepID=A0ABR0D1M0_9LAMI|nr:hypothetical protein RD792_009850 [Penstemon davidsonii]
MTNSMAISSSPDWSLATFINYNSSSCRTKSIITRYPFISFLFLNLNLRAVKLNSSNCSSPLVLENEAQTNEAQVILALKLQDFESIDNLPKDSKKLNVLICNLFNNSQTENVAYGYFEKAKENPDFTPQKYTLRLLIRYLIRSENWALLFSFIDDLKKFRVSPDSVTCCRLISTCVKARKFKIVNTLLDVLLTIDVGIAVLGFDSAMKGFNQLHMYSSTIVLYQRMKSMGIDLDSACYCRIMEAHLKMKQSERVVNIFQEFENKKLIKIGGDSRIYSKIYWILCESLGKMGRSFEALEFFREMLKRGIPESHSLYSSLISSFASIGEIKIAEELLEEAESKKMLRDPALFLKLVLRYVEEGRMERTLDVVSLMKRVEIRVSDCIFCAIVNGFSKKRGLKSAVKVYEDLVFQECEPGQVTYASILNIYFRLGLYSKAESIFSEMENKGFDKCVVAYSTMIASYGKMGRVKDAMKLVAKMKEKGCEPNVWTYNSLLDMHGKALNLKLVEKTWKEMKRRKVLPDRVSYTTVISAYNRAKEFEMCIKYFKEFKLNGGTLDRAMAGIMVAVFAKTNRVDELVELLQDMKMEGTELDARFYSSAMNALRDAGLQMQMRWLEQSFKYS